MSFDWQQLLSAHSVPFVTRGPNTGPGHISVRCPWCGESDPSQHLSISLSGDGYRCLRNPTAHRGRSRAYLIGALLAVPVEEARRLAGYSDEPAPLADEDFAARLASYLGAETLLPELRRPLQTPSEFRPLLAAKGTVSAPFWDYLRTRGYGPKGSRWAAEAYRLLYAIRGPYRYRLVIPIYTARRELASWTARSILKGELPRYKTLPSARRPGYDGPVSYIPPPKLLLGLSFLERVENPDTLVICEGPLDAIRVSTLGHGCGIYGTCLFGLNVSEEQVDLLHRLARRFRQLVLLLDPDASLIVLRIVERLAGLKVRLDSLPDGIEDPGALTASAATPLFESWRA